MSNDIARYDDGLPVLADDTLIQIAKQAEARIDAVVKIKQLALKVTNKDDWVDQDGKPYLMASGAEKVANLFNISWRIDEPIMDQEADGAITYNYKGYFSMAGRSIEVEGSRSSRDTFFNKYEYVNGQKAGLKPLDRRDLKMAALTNLLGNGITRILGIRNLTYVDLERFAGIKQGEVKGVKYQKRTDKEPSSLKEPESKPDTGLISDPQKNKIMAMLSGKGYKTEETKHNFAATLLGKEPEGFHFSTLTKAEASKLIEEIPKAE
jgi:hypothetical protein